MTDPTTRETYDRAEGEGNFEIYCSTCGGYVRTTLTEGPKTILICPHQSLSLPPEWIDEGAVETLLTRRGA